MVVVGQVARFVLPVCVVERAVQEFALVGQVPAVVTRGSVARRSVHVGTGAAVDGHDTGSSAFSESNARLRRQNTTPTPTSAPAPATSGMIQMIGIPPASGGTKRMVWPYSDTSTWSMSAPDRPCATRLSIWCRTAMAVVAFDWATETSVHDGQRTPASTAAARCDAVWGVRVEEPAPDDERHPEDDERKRDAGPQGQPRALTHGADGLLRLGGGQERVEVLLGGRSDERRGDAAGGIDDEGRGRCRHPVALRDRPARVAHGGPEVAVGPQERAAVPTVSWNTTLTMSAPRTAWVCS